MTRQRLEQLAREWQRFATVRAFRWVYVAACLAVVPLALHPGYSWVIPLLAVLLGAAFHYWRSALTRRLTAAQVVRHLDRRHPELEESSHLWLRPAESLTLLERLQLDRLDRAAQRLSGALPVADRFGQPPPYRRSTLLFALAGVGFILAVEIGLALRPARPLAVAKAASAPTAVTIPTPPAAPVWPKITAAGLTITPPAYTGHPPRQVAGFNAEIEENAAVAWTLALDRPVRGACLVFGPAAADVLPLQPSADQRLRAVRPFSETSLYTFAATLPDGTPWTPPEVYSLKVVKDQPPTVRIIQPAEARTVILPSPPLPSNESLPGAAPPHPACCFVEVEAGDDYGLADAHLVATVAKGSGEAVKFREQTIPFDGDSEEEPSPGSPSRSRRFTKTLDLAALGLEPGDELYFYVEARDNRQPAPNRTRSETRFLVLQGPDKSAATTGRGVAGVNLVPQYFRSERQLIIDTEKLLADRPTLPDREFRSRANDLGADQALLRLRYGQFLGEDQEDGPAADHAEVNLNPLQASAPPPKPGPHAAASITQRFMQEHAEQDTEGGSDESRDASLRSAPTTPLRADQVRQPYVDSHDTQDKATYFDQQSKGTMKDALSAMWAAEGALRVAQPQDALAPEHRALDIIKDLQQSARAYVQHVGFDAPPLKIDERRLKGDAADVPPRLSEPDAAPTADAAQAAVRAALAGLPPAGPARQETLRRVEPALTAAATHRPDDFLPGLQALRRLATAGAGDAADAADLPVLERALLRLLPPATPLPERPPEVDPSLAASYFRALQSHEPKP